MPFVPILTILPEFGGPFLWSRERADERGVGPCLCDSMGWDESMPLSEGLFQKFMDWTLTLGQSEHSFSGFPDDWDWIAFHARGMQLAHWLKEEVGDDYRVVYYKAPEDPNHWLNERTEILADGGLQSLPPFRGPTGPKRFCEQIVSGGQTGADRAALDFAIECGYAHGGSAPHGRKAEDGPIPMKYQLTELSQGEGYRKRMRCNVQNSDATLIVNLGALDGGTLATQTYALRSGKPCLVAQADSSDFVRQAPAIIAWLREHKVERLNVAGPRESKRPGSYRATRELLAAVDAVFRRFGAP